MGSFANSLFKFMLGWLQGAVAAVWSAFTSQNGSALFNWIGRYWILIAGILCLIGLAADLCVYLFRWKPFRVWRRFFSRGRETDETGAELPGPAVSEAPVPIRPEPAQEPDLTRWEPEPAPDATTVVQPVKKPAMVTHAGYVVPEDSPYRRPVQNKPETGIPVPPEPITPQTEDRTGRQEPVPLTPRRRRRISVSELFTDPEEELKEFDAPQNIIDSRTAYRAPVYPSGWKKSEEDGE